MNVSTTITVRSTVFVGLDVHKKTIALAALGDSGTEFLLEKVLETKDLSKLRKILKKLADGHELEICYEASGAGFALARVIEDWGFRCAVIAPSKIPVKPGEKRKNDRFDAQNLARYLRSGLLTCVHIPTSEEEEVRDFVRLRSTCGKDLRRAQQRLIKFLRRLGHVFHDGDHWTQKFWTWTKQLPFAGVREETFTDLVHEVERLVDRLRRLEKRVAELAASPQYAPKVNLLRGFRGIDTTSAMVLVTELGDVTRFSSPRQLMSYLGLTPTEHSSGESVRRGGISRAGNARCRHVTVQAAWNYTRRPTVGKILKKRQQGLPEWAIENSWNAQQRLHKRFHKLAQTRSRQVAAVAVARELIGFVWAALRRQHAETAQARG